MKLSNLQLSVTNEISRNLIPTIIQNAQTGQVLMLGYSDENAMKKTAETGLVHFFSRSRETLWLKGETSGNTLCLINAYLDCDEDTLLYEVLPKGPTCHTGSISCFTEVSRSFDPLSLLARELLEKSLSPRPGSYTQKLIMGSKSTLMRKLVEEAAEVSEAFIESQPNLPEEIADLLYHLTVLMQRAEVSYEQVYAVLEARKK